MHQSSALSPLLVVIVKEAISREFRDALLGESGSNLFQITGECVYVLSEIVMEDTLCATDEELPAKKSKKSRHKHHKHKRHESSEVRREKSVRTSLV